MQYVGGRDCFHELLLCVKVAGTCSAVNLLCEGSKINEQISVGLIEGLTVLEAVEGAVLSSEICTW